MSTIVIMPGGFHPFHAGHAALYNSAQRAFPGADVYVAATNDTGSRPFPFAIKEKLAQLAGVDKGRFMQVKSPFRAEEITAPYNPKKDKLIFIRSQKDADKQPLAGGVKKDGEPAYLQPLESATKLEPFGKHAYMAYLPTVEFGPGMTSATEIRGAWPTLNEKRKTALVMSLYPKTQTNPKLAATVVKMLDTAMGGEQGVAEGSSLVDRVQQIIEKNHQDGEWTGQDLVEFIQDTYDGQIPDEEEFYDDIDAEEFEDNFFNELVQVGAFKQGVTEKLGDNRPKLGSKRDAGKSVRKWRSERGLDEVDAQNFVGGMTASYQQRENQPVAEDYMEEKQS